MPIKIWLTHLPPEAQRAPLYGGVRMNPLLHGLQQFTRSRTPRYNKLMGGLMV